MNPNSELDQLALETAEGLFRLYGTNTLIQVELIAARMKKLKDEKSAILWTKIADIAKTIQA
jgi:hypothetical protein